MTDSPPDPFPFEPVSTARKRRDGWTPERQRAFIAALGKIGMVSAAAAEVGMSRKSAYALLARAGPESSFARAFEEAHQAGQTSVFFTTADRAINGVEVPYFYRGKQIGVRRVYDNRLLIAAFRTLERAQRAPKKRRRK
jgi:predicted DsbA family dithiol-disulfide isomerase